MEVFVDGTDLENLVLTGSNGGIVRGRVVSEEGPLPKLTDIGITISPTHRNQPPPVLLGAFRDTRGAPDVQEDGAFTVQNVFGRARFQVRLPDGWMLKSVTHQGRDITDGELQLNSGEQISGVEVLITRRVTQVDGQVTDAKGAPVGEATVLLFPSDPDRWYENARTIRATRPDQQGRWQVKAMPAGEYLAIALDYIEVDAWQDPDYLASLREHAKRLTIPDGGSQTLSLQVIVPQKQGQ